MAVMYCGLCERPVDARRQIGGWTVLFAIASAGVTLMAVPFYPKRCAICKSTAVSHVPPGWSGNRRMPAGKDLSRLEERLGQALAELEQVKFELDRVQTERDFYRQLLEDPAARERSRFRKP